MARWGWSTGMPFTSTVSTPPVTNDDYSYITSEDLETQGYHSPSSPRDSRLPLFDPRDQERYRYANDASHQRVPISPTSTIPSAAMVMEGQRPPEDDVLMFRQPTGNRFPERFPAYSIGDGKLLVMDVRERIKIIFGIGDRDARRVRLLYKGKELVDGNKPVRHYGVKNKSEILIQPDGAGVGLVGGRVARDRVGDRVGDMDMDGEASDDGEIVIVQPIDDEDLVDDDDREDVHSGHRRSNGGGRSRRPSRGPSPARRRKGKGPSKGNRSPQDETGSATGSATGSNVDSNAGSTASYYHPSPAPRQSQRDVRDHQQQQYPPLQDEDHDGYNNRRRPESGSAVGSSAEAGPGSGGRGGGGGGGRGGGGGGGGGGGPPLSTPEMPRARSPASAVSGVSGTESALSAAAAAAIAAGPVVPGGPVDKLNGIREIFDSNFKPKCTQFLVHPPTDKKKLQDEHRRLAETLLAQVLLKLDAVDLNGQDLARKYRKELVNQVNAMLRMLDEAVGK